MKNNNVLKTFLELVKIPSPSGDEGKVATYIEKCMAEYGFKVWNDKLGIKNNCNTGNIYAYLEVDKNLPTLAFSAHMDTVQKVGDLVKPKISKGYITSNGKTILGADNKAGVAVLIETAGIIDKNKSKNNLLFFFPTREEAGVMGSSLFKFEGPQIKYFFNLDSSDKPGIFIYKSLGYINFEIKVKGLSAHAAKSYDKGIDAIKATSLLITKLPIGKNVVDGFTLNLGIINGGSSTNVVCDLVTLKGELRAFDDITFKKLKNQINNTAGEISKLSGAKISVMFDKHSYIPPFIGQSKSDLVDICQQACKQVGLSFETKESYSTSDSNFYSNKGFQTISVSRGGENAHSVNEKLKVSHLDQTIGLITSIINFA